MISVILLHSSVLVLAICILRIIAIRYFPKNMFVVLWKIVILRFMIPFSWKVSFAAVPEMNKIAAGYKEMFLQRFFPEGDSFQLYFRIWGLGAVICLIILLWNYQKAYRLLSEAIPIDKCQATIFDKDIKAVAKTNVKIFISDRISSPLTYGIIHPRIVLPKNSDFEDMDHMTHIIMHESVHISKKDNLWKLISAVMLCVYWFDLFSWIMCYCFSRDIELACDEKVLSVLSEEKRKEYAYSLLRIAESRTKLPNIYSSFGKCGIEERIEFIMRYRKMKTAVIVTAGFICMSALTVFASVGKTVSVEASADQNQEEIISPVFSSEKEEAAAIEALHEENRQIIAQYEKNKN